MYDTGLDLNLETLRGSVSPAIFEFLSSADASTVARQQIILRTLTLLLTTTT